jgi:hypothetical protein
MLSSILWPQRQSNTLDRPRNLFSATQRYFCGAIPTNKQYLYWPDNVRLPDSDCESEYLCGQPGTTFAKSRRPVVLKGVKHNLFTLL